MDREFAIMLRRYIKTRKLRELQQDSVQWFEQVVGLDVETQQQQQQTQTQTLRTGVEAAVLFTSSPTLTPVRQGGSEGAEAGGAAAGKATVRDGSGRGTMAGPRPAAEGRWAGSLEVL